VFDLFFPRTCPGCGKVISRKERAICPECLRTLPRTETAWHEDNSVDQLFYAEKHYARGASFCFYQQGNLLQRCIEAFKYDGMPSVGHCLAQEAVADLIHTDFLEDIDYIVPVPLHPRKLRKRGYNQSEVISQAIAAASHIPLENKRLIRIINNPTQTHLSSAERKANTEHVFSLTDPAFFRGKHILLVDDIITTGATMQACMKAFSSVRNVKISVFSLGKTIRS